MNTEIVSFETEAEHLQPLIELGRAYYPADHYVLTQPYLRWLYLENPAGAATLVVAQESELWIGLIALVPVDLLLPDGRPQKACYAVNVLTHPEHRGKNLFVKMISHTCQILSSAGIWLIGHPNANAMPGWVRKKMTFRPPLHVHLAKMRIPNLAVKKTRISTIAELRALSPDFWKEAVSMDGARIKYSPDYIAWRFLGAPHRNYDVYAIESRGKFLGLRVTRYFRKAVNLMVDFVGPAATLGSLIGSVQWPTIVLHSEEGLVGREVRRGSWRMPLRREIPFFVTTWMQDGDPDMSGITLAASDF